MKPLVSVVITTYNSASSVERVLKSIFNQSYENIEILIFDDASTDNTKNIALSYCVNFSERKFDNYSNQRNFAINKLDIKAYYFGYFFKW